MCHGHASTGRPLADWLHTRGFKLGLYSDAGTATCQHRAGSLGFEQRDAQTCALHLPPLTALPGGEGGGAVAPRRGIEGSVAQTAAFLCACARAYRPSNVRSCALGLVGGKHAT